MGIIGNASPCFPTSHLIPLSALLAMASAWDIRKRRIPNWISAIVVLTGLYTQATYGGWKSVLSGVGSGVVMIAVLWKPWLGGRIGGGDVKLAGATAVWLGLLLLPHYILAVALGGGVVGAICYLWSDISARREIKTNLTLAAGALLLPEAPIRGGQGRISVPYGVAVSIGALVVLWTQGG